MRRPTSEIISIVITAALVFVMIGDGAVLAYQAVRGLPVDQSLKEVFRDIVLVFATAWKTDHRGQTTITTEQANVSAGGGSPATANVETMNVSAPVTESEPGTATDGTG